jgi:myo-inositol-1(or 4)-monophosphatase
MADPDSLHLQDVLHHSLLIARESAAIVRESFEKYSNNNILSSDLAIQYKPDSSIVTSIDKASQDMIVAYLRQHFTDHGLSFVAEEQSTIENYTSAQKDHYYFVIDPLDGTATFLEGIPFFCVSIALCRGSKSLIGVLVDPNHNEEFTAIAGNGAFLNGEPCFVSRRSEISELRVNVNHNKLDQQLFDNINNNIIKKLDIFHKLGSLCLEVAYVACGRLDATINNYVSMWDIAAAGVILEEAGGKWTTFNGIKPKFPILEKFHVCATNGIVHQNILDRMVAGNGW